MPTYDYLCDACEHKFEEFQSITADVLTKCPKCKKKKLRRLFGTGAAVVFKGSGFYQTDYRSDGYKKAVAAEKESSGSKNPTSSDSKKSDAGGSPATSPATSAAKPSDSQSTSSSSEKSAKKSKPKE